MIRALVHRSRPLCIYRLVVMCRGCSVLGVENAHPNTWPTGELTCAVYLFVSTGAEPRHLYTPVTVFPTDVDAAASAAEAHEVAARYFLQFTVVDTGCGVAPADAARLLEPYFQSEASKNNTSFTGSGLGLGAWAMR